MVSAETLDIINYAKDIDITFNMKLFFICVLVLYAIIFFYIDRKYLKDTFRPSFKIASLFVKAYYFLIFIYGPNLIFQLTRTADISFFLIMNQLTYMLLAVGGIIILALYLIERLFSDFLGWEIRLDGFKITTNKIL